MPGNTSRHFWSIIKMSPKMRAFVFTWNNPPEDHHSWFENYDGLAYCIYQLEVGESGTPHLQGYIELKNRTRFEKLAKLAKWHIEKRKGSQQQAIDYSSKEDTRVEGPWTLGEAKKQGQRTDIEAAYKAIALGKRKRDVAEEHTVVDAKYHRALDRYRNLVEKDERQAQREVDVHVYYGGAGTGKTRKAFDENPSLYKIAFDGKAVWFDGYEGEDTLLIDEFYGQMPWGFLLQVLDRYPLRLAIKGGFTYANWTKVIITSNKSPTEWYTRDSYDALLRRITKTIKM